MEILTQKAGGATVMTLTGRLDAVTAPQYEKNVRVLIEGDDCHFVADFTGLEYISSAGLRGLLVTAKLLSAKGKQVRFANVTGAIKEVFEVSGFDSIFQLDESVEAALNALA
ncbi:MAG: STAS domain-containing protein [Deltaproteobacteria bacterium]|nr:STAS domain-containing protein [Deltaproteobacteria bacterium]